MVDTQNSVNAAVSSALKGNSASQKQAADELRNSFMTLLVTQLQNQDPLKPLENAELTSQLAQINTVSGINDLNNTLEGITSQIEAGQSLQAAELIGKGVLVPGDRMLVGEGGVSTPFGVDLAQGATEMQAKIVGIDGQVLSTLNLGAAQAGVRSFQWDGKLDSGETAAEGAYRVVVEAKNAEGDSLSVRLLNYAMVNGVGRTPQGDISLDLGGVTDPVNLDEIRKIL